MSVARLGGEYDGEGPSVSTSQPTLPPDAANSNAPVYPLAAKFDRRSRVRTSSESARDGIAMSFTNTLGGTIQQLSKASRGFYCSGAGTLQCVLSETSGANTTTGAGYLTFVGLLAGVVYPFSISYAVAASTTATGIFLL